MVFMASFSGLQQRNEKSFSKRVQLQFYTTSYYFGEYKVTTFLSLTINIFVIKLTRKWKKNHFCFSNPKLPPLKAAQSRAKSKLPVRLDKLGMLAGKTQDAKCILDFDIFICDVCYLIEKDQCDLKHYKPFYSALLVS